MPQSRILQFFDPPMSGQLVGAAVRADVLTRRKTRRRPLAALQKLIGKLLETCNEKYSIQF
jgi:hypothetical protein